MMFLKTAALAIALAAPAAADPQVVAGPATSEPVLELMAELDVWLDANSGLARPPSPLSRVEFVEPGSEVLYEGRMTKLDNTVRGLYDEDLSTIYLVNPWTGDDAYERSILLHEMLHHRQAAARHWYCPQAMEWDAYLTQEAYLNAHGETGDFNWGWVVLASSCAPRDVHGD